MPQKHDNYARKVFDGIGEGGGGGVVKVITRTVTAVKKKISNQKPVKLRYR
jgi:hypothetical protein